MGTYSSAAGPRATGQPRQSAWGQPYFGGALVDRGIGGHGGEEGVLAALATQHRGPQALRVLAEDLLPARGLDDPGLLLELGLELARAPARVAGEHAGAGHAVGDLAEVAGVAADEAEVVVQEHAGHRRLVELGEHDHGVRGDR